MAYMARFALTSQARWEAKSEHGSDIPLHRVTEDPLLQAQDRFIHKAGDHPHLDVLIRGAADPKENRTWRSYTAAL